MALSPRDQDLMTTSDKLSQSPDYSVGSIVFERFEIVDVVASGAQGRVFKARDLMLDKTVALKVLLGTTKNDRDIVRFQHEARLASKMKHQGIATIYDFGIRNNCPFLSMEFVDGESLEAILEREHTLSLLDFLEIFLQVCDAIQHAHQAGIIHRDIKPSNIIVSKNEHGSVRAKVLDFGVAKTLDIIQENKGRLTPTGNIVGSPYYMSPEQSKSQPLTTKSDNYSLGCVMWTAIVGEPPFVCDNVMETLLCHGNTAPPKIAKLVDDKFPLQLTELIDGLLAKKPADRPDLKGVVIPTLVELLNSCIADLQKVATADSAQPSGSANNEIETVTPKRGSKLLLGFAACGLLIVTGVLIAIQLSRNTHLDSFSVSKTSHNDFMDGLKVGTVKEAEALNEETTEMFVERVRQGLKHDLSLGLDLKRETLVECTKLPALYRLDLTVASVYDSDLKVIAKIPNLRYLSLNRTQVKTLDGIDKVAKLKGLELKNTEISNSSLENVSKLNNLENLNLTHDNVDAEGIKYLLGMPKLRDLDLSGVPIDAATAKIIGTLPHLQTITLRDSKISYASLRDILNSDSLIVIRMENNQSIDNDQLMKLRFDFPSVTFTPRSSMLKQLNKQIEAAELKYNYQEAYDRSKDLIRLLTRRYGAKSAITLEKCAKLSVYAAMLRKTSEAAQLGAKASRVDDNKSEEAGKVKSMILELEAAQKSQKLPASKKSHNPSE